MNPRGSSGGAPLDTLTRWLEWQYEHTQALEALQQAERAYHRLSPDERIRSRHQVPPAPSRFMTSGAAQRAPRRSTGSQITRHGYGSGLRTAGHYQISSLPPGSAARGTFRMGVPSVSSPHPRTRAVLAIPSAILHHALTTSAVGVSLCKPFGKLRSDAGRVTAAAPSFAGGGVTMIGTTVGKYRFVDILGRGGVGTVYRAVDETLDREVAITVLNGDLLQSDGVKRFRSEAVTLAKLNHPRIAHLYELDRPLDMRIAIHSGRALTGDIGSPRRREFTVLGDTVNIASRLQSMVAKPGQIVISRETLDRAGGGFRTEPLGPFTRRGRQSAVEVFAVLD